MYTFYRDSDISGKHLVPFHEIPLSHMFADKDGRCILLKLLRHIVIINNGSIMDTDLFLKNYTDSSRFRLVTSARFTTEATS